MWFEWGRFYSGNYHPTKFGFWAVRHGHVHVRYCFIVCSKYYMHVINGCVLMLTILHIYNGQFFKNRVVFSLLQYHQSLNEVLWKLVTKGSSQYYSYYSRHLMLEFWVVELPENAISKGLHKLIHQKTQAEILNYFWENLFGSEVRHFLSGFFRSTKTARRQF